MPNVTAVDSGTVVEKTVRTRVLSKEEAAAQEKEKYKYDPFELQDRLKAANEPWSNDMIAYIWRADPPVFRGSNEPTYVGKYTTFFSVEDMQKDFGGGRFRILIKIGQERAADKTVNLAGVPRDLTSSLDQFKSTQPGNGATEQTPTNATVLSQALTAATNPAAQAAQIDMLKTAATASVDMVKANAAHQLSITEIIAIAKELSPKQAGFLDGPFGPIAIAVVTKLVDKLFTDPLEHFTKMMELAKMFGGGASTANDWKTAMVQAAPQLANAVTAGLHELRLGAEAQGPRPMQQQLPPASAPPSSAPNPGATAGSPAIAGSQATAGNNVITMAGPEKQPPLPGTAPAAGPQRMEVPLQFIWQKIYEFMDDATKTGADIGKFLDELDPSFIESVKAYTVEQIQGFVSANASIAFVAAHPRFKQCLTELLAWANQPEPPATKPA